MDKEEVEKETLKAVVEENRKFRKEMMKILYGLIFGLCVTVLIIIIGWISVTHIYFYSPSDYSVESNATSTNINTNINENVKSKSDKEVEIDLDKYNYAKKGSEKVGDK